MDIPGLLWEGTCSITPSRFYIYSILVKVNSFSLTFYIIFFLKFSFIFIILEIGNVYHRQSFVSVSYFLLFFSKFYLFSHIGNIGFYCYCVPKARLFSFMRWLNLSLLGIIDLAFYVLVNCSFSGQLECDYMFVTSVLIVCKYLSLLKCF